jgi:hypothetical protein
MAGKRGAPTGRCAPAQRAAVAVAVAVVPQGRSTAATEASFLAAAMISNVPQAIGPSTDLAATGWSASRLGRLWGLVVLACAVAAALGCAAAHASSEVDGTRMAAIAAGRRWRRGPR